LRTTGFRRRRAARTARQNDEPHSVPQQPNDKSDEHGHPLIMPELAYAGNLVNFALIQLLAHRRLWYKRAELLTLAGRCSFQSLPGVSSISY
jgi:hypothetical protein